MNCTILLECHSVEHTRKKYHLWICLCVSEELTSCFILQTPAHGSICVPSVSSLGTALLWKVIKTTTPAEASDYFHRTKCFDYFLKYATDWQIYSVWTFVSSRANCANVYSFDLMMRAKCSFWNLELAFRQTKNTSQKSGIFFNQKVCSQVQYCFNAKNNRFKWVLTVSWDLLDSITVGLLSFGAGG